MLVPAIISFLTGALTLKFQYTTSGALLSFGYMALGFAMFLEIYTKNQYKYLTYGLLSIAAAFSVYQYLTEKVYPELSLILLCFSAFGTLLIVMTIDRAREISLSASSQYEPKALTLQPVIKRRKLYLGTATFLIVILVLGFGAEIMGSWLSNKIGPSGGVALLLPFTIFGMGLYVVYGVFFLFPALIICILVDIAVTQATRGRKNEAGLFSGILAGVILMLVLISNFKNYGLDRKFKLLNIGYSAAAMGRH